MEVVGRCEDHLGGSQGDGMEKANKCDGMEKANKCDTIRGYVANVRKQDVKTCWPLSVPHSQTVEELVSSLPPLIVPNFRRWCCCDCLDSIIASEDAKGSLAVSTENEGARIKDFSLVLKDCADKLHSSFQQRHRVEAFGAEVSRLGTSSVNVNAEGGNVRPVLCHDAKEVQNLTKEFIGNHLSHFIHSGSEVVQPQPSHSAVAAAEHKSSDAAGDVREDVTVYLINLNTSPHGKSINNSVHVKISDIDLNLAYECDDISGGDLPYNRVDIVASSHGNYDRNSGVKTKLFPDDVSSKNNVVLNGSCNGKDAALYITESPSTSQELVDLDQTKDNRSCHVDLSDYVDDEKYGRVAGSSNGKLNYNKARKIRLRSLEDIMRNPKDLCLSKGDARLSRTKSVHDGPCRLNCEAKHSSENQLTRQKGESAFVKCLVGSQANENYDEETSLNHWLMSVSKKSIAGKGSSLIKHTEDKACYSIGTSCKKGVHHQEKISRERPQQTDVKEKENKIPRIQSGNPSPSSQHNNTKTGDELIKFVNSKPNQTRRRNGISKKTLHIDHHNIDNSSDEMFDRYNKSKIIKSPSRKWPKKEARKKQRTANKSGEANLDDIPMDVVEILAKIQHEKYLSGAKFSTDTNYSVPVPSDSCIARGCRSNSLDTMHTDPDTSNDAEHGLHIRAKDFQFRPEACDSSKNQRRNLHIDLNQLAADSHQAMSDCNGHNYFEAVPPFNYSNVIHSCQYLPWDKIKMQPFGSYYGDRLSFAQSSSRTVPDRLSLPANDRIFGVGMRMSCPKQMCVHTDSPNGYLKGRLVTAVESSEEVRKPSDPYILNVGWKVEQSTNKMPLPFETCRMQGQNEGHFGTGELSCSRSNDIVSATNLLRLVNEAAFSGASLDRNYAANYGACCSSPCSVIHGSEVGIRSKEMWRASCYSQGQNSITISQPHRPVARIGVFGHSLRDEMIRINKYGTTLDSEGRWADELPHLQISGEKEEYSYSPAQFKCSNMDHTIFTRENMPTISAGRSLVQGYTSSRYGTDQVAISYKGKAVQHGRNTCATDCCIDNRNPADFTLPDNDNEYMREVKV